MDKKLFKISVISLLSVATLTMSVAISSTYKNSLKEVYGDTSNIKELVISNKNNNFPNQEGNFIYDIDVGNNNLITFKVKNAAKDQDNNLIIKKDGYLLNTFEKEKQYHNRLSGLSKIKVNSNINIKLSYGWDKDMNDLPNQYYYSYQDIELESNTWIDLNGYPSYFKIYNTSNSDCVINDINLQFNCVSSYVEEDIQSTNNPYDLLKGKNMWIFGDSITAGVGTTAPHTFPELLTNSLDCKLTKRGYSGYAFSHGINDYGYTILNIMDQALKGADGNCDILLVCFGVNDWTWGRNIKDDRAIGTINDNTKYTIYGALNLFCEKLENVFKTKMPKVYFCTPTPTSWAPISGGNYSGWDQNKKNFNGNTIRDICDAMINIANKYNHDYLDLNRDFDVDMSNEAELDSLFTDGLHPNEEGNHVLGNTLEKLLLQKYIKL